MVSYSDEQLTRAVVGARSWRGVLRALGLPENSSGAARTARVRANALALDHSHFTGQRRWNYAQLADAVSDSTTWAEVLRKLGLSEATSTTAVRAHVVRFGLNAAHLSPEHRRRWPTAQALSPDVKLLPRAGAHLAAAWFQLCGCRTSWPSEPAAYDLLVDRDGTLRRVQVKTTRHRTGASWTVKLTSASRSDGIYDPDDLDDLFVVTADGTCYLIPFPAVAGLSAINLAAYGTYALSALPFLPRTHLDVDRGADEPELLA